MTIDEIVSEALAVVKAGGLILYPTDTVWGIGCDATNEAAVQKVFALKRRSGAKSLVLLASDLDMVARYVRQIPPMAVQLVEVNDAPMTIVYPGAVVQQGADGKTGADVRPGASPAAGNPYALAPSTVAEDGTVGIRIPIVGMAEDAAPSRRGPGADPDDGFGELAVSAGARFCNKLIFKLRRPLVSTSANISGEDTPERFEDIAPEIREGVDYVVPASFQVLVAGKGKPHAERFDDTASGRSSQIIKVGLDGEVEIIRP